VAAGTDTVGNTASGTSQGSGSITPPETDCLVVSGMTYNVAPNGVGVPSGFTVPSGASIDAVNAVSFGYYFAYEIQTAIVTRSPTWTLDTSASFMSVASVIFKDTGTGGGGSNWGPMLGQQLNRIVQG
jgi:hypothetical protein